jgi:hypothetical protein
VQNGLTICANVQNGLTIRLLGLEMVNLWLLRFKPLFKHYATMANTCKAWQSRLEHLVQKDIAMTFCEKTNNTQVYDIIDKRISPS